MDIRLADIRTFLAVHRCGTLSNAARELKVTPSQVSRAMSRLEGQLKVPLLARSFRGVTLSDAGREMVGQLSAVAAQLDQLVHHGSRKATLTMAAPSSLLHILLPHIAKARPKLKLRAFQLATEMIRSLLTTQVFDLTVLVDPSMIPPTWEAREIGSLRTALFGSPALAKQLGPFPVRQDRIKGVPFIMPVHLANGQLVIPDNDCACPLPRDERVVGHEANTTMLSLEIATHVDQLVYAPALAASSYVRAGALVEIPVEGWDVVQSLWLVGNVERVKAADFKAMVEALKSVLTPAAKPRVA